MSEELFEPLYKQLSEKPAVYNLVKIKKAFDFADK